MRKAIVLLVLLFVGNVSVAARLWSIQNNYVKDVSVSSENPSGTTYNVIRIYLKEPIDTGCSVSDPDQLVTYWIADDFNNAMSSWISTALAAQAQNKKVDILINTATCNGTFGRMFHGIVVHGE